MHRVLSGVLLYISLFLVVYSQKYTSLQGIKNIGTYEFDFSEDVFKKTGGKNCTKPGPMCGDCKTLYECIQIGDNYLKEKLEDCAIGYTCLETPPTASCTTGHNPDCDVNIYIFTCHQVGLFPDPFDCKKYHLCIPDVEQNNGVNPRSLPQYCDGGYYYDAKTTLCRKKLVNGTCPEGCVCTALGQAGLIHSNPALYYICLRQGSGNGYYPNIFCCPRDTEYDLVTKSCVDTSPELGTGPDGMCLKVGLFYDPKRCSYYYQCAFVGEAPTRYSCGKKRFDHKTQECVDFTCADLDKD